MGFEQHRQRIAEEVASETLHDRLTNLLTELGYTEDQTDRLLGKFDMARKKLSVRTPVEFDVNEITTLLLAIVEEQHKRITELERTLLHFQNWWR